jgi:replicative DNA helicase
MTSDTAAPLGGARGLASRALEQMLPNSQDAEMAVLGAVLLNPAEVGALVRERLDESHFYYAAHQVVFREIAGLQDSLAAVDLVTLSQRLANKGLLDEVGGAAFLADLVNHVPTTANITHYIDIVLEKHLLRKLINTAHEIIQRSFNEQDDVKTWIDEVEQQVFNINSEKTASGARPTSELVHEAMDSIEKMYQNRGTITGLSTGFRDLDKITSGLHPGTMFVIAARPSMGKTALAMNIAENVAIDQGRPVGVFSLEMSSEELVKRMLSSRGAVNLRALHDGYPREKDHGALTTAASELVKAPMFIDDTPGLTVNQLRARARRMHSQHKLELIVIDYMQLMRAPSRRADQSRQVEVADISASVKGLAKELRIPIIILSQLNRQPDARDDGKPRLSDLRESGAIEQDADIVGLLVRPEVYEDDREAREQLKGKATLYIAKQRNGPTGDVPLTFRHDYTRFENTARISDEDIPGGVRE